MLDELKKPLEDLISTGKDTIGNAVKNSTESKLFFERLSEKIAIYTGHTAVENEELKYDKNYVPEGDDK